MSETEQPKKRVDKRQYLRPFPKGVSGNPNGRTKLNAQWAHIDTYGPLHVKKAISLHFQMSWQQIIELLNDKTQSAIDLVFASAINKAILTGDIMKVIPLIERVAGKVQESPQELNINLQQISNAELVELGKQAIAVLEAETMPVPQIQEGTDASTDPA